MISGRNHKKREKDRITIHMLTLNIIHNTGIQRFSKMVHYSQCTTEHGQPWKKRSERRKHCMLAVVRWSQQIFNPSADPSAGAQDGQNLISCRWTLPSPTYPVWWWLTHTISSYRGNRPTNKPTHRQDRLQYTPLLSLARSVTKYRMWPKFFAGNRSERSLKNLLQQLLVFPWLCMT